MSVRETAHLPNIGKGKKKRGILPFVLSFTSQLGVERSVNPGKSSISASNAMDLPQSKTDDCLMDLGGSTDDLEIPPKPPYPKHFSKNILSYEPNQQELQEHVKSQLDTAEAPSAPLKYPLAKVFSNCNSHSLESHKISGASRRPSGLSYIGYKYSRAVIQDPSTGCCLRICCRGWMGILQLLIALRAILARFVFLALTLTLVVTVVRAKGDNIYWMLCLLMLPLLADLCYSIVFVVTPRRTQDRTEKWFTKCLLAYLFCACPPIWIIELHQLQQLNEATDAVINSQGIVKPGEVMLTRNPWMEAGLVYNEPGENLVMMGDTVENYLNAAAMRQNITIKSGISRSSHRIKRSPEDAVIRFPTQEESLIQAVTLQHYPLKMRVRIMEQLLLLSVIVGRWLLPRLGISRDQLSQLLLINIGNAADILELFEAFNEEAVRTNTSLNICILCLWQASLLQFCFNKTATLERPNQVPPQAPSLLRSVSRSTTFNELLIDEQMQIQLESHLSPPKRRHFCDCCSNDSSDDHISGCGHLWFGTELWAIFMSLILQDVPFLALRLTLVLHFNVRSYSNIFFTCKNSLLILLQVFRSSVILSEFRRNWSNAKSEIPMILVP